VTITSLQTSLQIFLINDTKMATVISMECELILFAKDSVSRFTCGGSCRSRAFILNEC
jgi:hypothetical protein